MTREQMELLLEVMEAKIAKHTRSGVAYLNACQRDHELSQKLLSTYKRSKEKSK